MSFIFHVLLVAEVCIADEYSVFRHSPLVSFTLGLLLL